MVFSTTWKKHPGSADYETGGNWVAGLVPATTAFFGASGKTHLTFSAETNIGGWTFKKDAPHYVFTTVSDHHLYFLDDGIVIKGGGVSIVNNYLLVFLSSSTAATAKIANAQALYFQDSSSAGHARIVNNGEIFNFEDTSTAAKAIITNNNNLNFVDSSTSGRAHIVNNDSLTYSDLSSAGGAQITNNGTMTFEGQSHAGGATITTTSGHILIFTNTSSGETARLIAQTGSQVDFTGANGPANNHVVPVGSIAGGGEFNLGLNQLVVHSGKVSGLIFEGITFPGSSVGSLEKIGGGTLKLSHAGNGFSGGILLAGGVLDIAAIGAAGSGHIKFDPFIRSTLKIENAALSAHVFGTEVDGFHAGHIIDLAGLKFVKHAKATYDLGTHVLSVKSGHVVDTLTLDLSSATTFKAANDGHGGTKVVVVAPHSKSTADHGDSFQFKPDVSLGQQSHSGPDPIDRLPAIGAYLHDGAHASVMTEIAPHHNIADFAHRGEFFI